MSQRVSPRRGASADERHRADLALGDLPVMLEPVVGQAGGARQDARARIGDDFERDRVERGDVVEREALRLRRANAFAWAAHRLADVSRERPIPRAASSAASLARRRVVPGQARVCARPAADAGRSPRAGGRAARAARNPAGSSRAAPRRARRRKARARQIISSARDTAHQRRADAEEERIAARQHADRRRRAAPR